MNLRTKILLTLALAVAGATALTHAASQRLVMHGFANLEQRQLHDHLGRLTATLHRASADMAHSAAQFAQLEAVKAQSAPDAEFQRGARMDFWLRFDAEGCLQDARALEWRSGTARSLPAALRDALEASSPLLARWQSSDPRAGVLALPECPLLIAAAPIPTGNESETTGTIVVARWLDAPEIEALSGEGTARWMIFASSAAQSGDLQRQVRRVSEGQAVVVEAINDQRLTVCAPLHDVFGRPTLVGRVEMPRVIYQQGLAGQRYLFYALVALAGECALVIWFALDWFALRRLASMQEVLGEVAASGKVGPLIPSRGHDEISQLAFAFNAMSLSLREAEDARRQTDERLRQIVDSIDDVVWSLAPNGKQVLYVSGAAKTLFGVRIGAGATNGGPWQTLVVDEDEERVRDAFRRLQMGEFLDIEYRIRRADDTVRHIRNRARLVRDESGEPLRLDGIASDITETRRLSNELRRAHRDLIDNAHQAGKAEVATSVLHNVGNALNGVNVSASLVQSLVQNSALTGLQRVLQLVADQSERLDEFVSRDPRGKKLPQFLHAALPVLEQEHAALMRETSDLHGKIDYIKRIIQAQQEHARTAAMIEDTTVSSIVRDAVQLCGDRLQRHGVDLDLQLRVNPTVRVAKSHLVQVVINLLNNAVDATLAANPEDKRVIVRSQQSPEGRLEIVVRDSGVGIAQEYLQRVFQHGFTTKADGHGFGLHSCAVLLCSMGGAIRAQSDGPGQGAEFIVTLPRSAEFPAPTATAPTNQVSPAAPSAAPPLPTVDSGNDAASAAGVGITV